MQSEPRNLPMIQPNLVHSLGLRGICPLSVPTPDNGWSRGIIELQNAIVQPPNGHSRAFGAVYKNDESPCWEAMQWRGDVLPPIASALSFSGPALKGAYLWGGTMWSHFGHLMMDSTSRLWGLDHVAPSSLKGIIFTPRQAKNGTIIPRVATALLRELQVDLPIIVLTEPQSVETLIIPGQGFGAGIMGKGTPEFAQFFANRLGRHCVKKPDKKIYISRSALAGKRGGLIGEGKLEVILRRKGYEIFHPQKQSVATQIQTYCSASHIIGLDGSALHLNAMIPNREQKIAIVARRSSDAISQIAFHSHMLRDNAPNLFYHLIADWVRPEQMMPSMLSFGEPDLQSVLRSLKQTGFIKHFKAGVALSDADIHKYFKRRGLQSGETIIRKPAKIDAITFLDHQTQTSISLIQNPDQL